jgi:hypothetical protein
MDGRKARRNAESSVDLAAPIRRGVLRLAAWSLILGGVGLATLARASDADLVAEVHGKLVEVFDALATGDPAKVAPLLAPEFQVLRSDGGGYGKEDYLARSIPNIRNMPVFRDLVVTRNEDIVVVRLILEIDEVIDGKQGSARSPQLMVFRVGPEGWQVVAAANFSRLR